MYIWCVYIYKYINIVLPYHTYCVPTPSRTGAHEYLTLLHKGDTICVTRHVHERVMAGAEPEVLYETEAFCVVNKPAGVSCTNAENGKNTLCALVGEKYGRYAHSGPGRANSMYAPLFSACVDVLFYLLLASFDYHYFIPLYRIIVVESRVRVK